MARASLHDEIDASYSTFEHDGRVLIQIDTYGRLGRAMPGKKSQTIQLDAASAAELFQLLKRTFRFD